jgi:phage terminase small subunit
MSEKEMTAAEKLGEALKPRERRLVQEYLACRMNATQAAINLGYSEKTAASQASRMLRKPEVQAYRDALIQEQFDAIGVTKHSLAAEVWEIYQKCCQKEPVLEWDSSERKWVESGEWQFNAKGALKALEMLGNMLPGVRPAGSDKDKNNLLDVITAAEEINTDDLPEVE